VDCFKAYGARGGSMNKKVRLVVFAVSLLFLSASISFALDSDTGTDLNSDSLIAYSKSYTGHERLKDSKKLTVSYSIDDDEIVGKHLVHDKKKDKGFLSEIETSSSPFAYMPGQGSADPMVGNISYYLSHNRKKDAKSSKLDLMPSASLSEVATTGLAFLTNLLAHEFGHAIVADYAGAKGNELNFFKKDGGKFFLGTSSVTDIDERSIISYTMGGEFFADLTFEHALQSYRDKPTSFNKSLMMVSGTDFLWYCFYSFYLSEDHSSYDPITISRETGISRDMLFSAVLAKTAMNAYRIYSGEDKVIPYFTVDKYSASLNVSIPFQNLWMEKSELFN